MPIQYLRLYDAVRKLQIVQDAFNRLRQESGRCARDACALAIVGVRMDSDRWLLRRRRDPSASRLRSGKIMRTPLSCNELLARKSAEQSGDNPWTPAEVDAQLAELPGWALQDGAIERCFVFRDYYETIAFVNALAWVIHGENHHPDLLVGYNRCTVRFSTHSVGGISENDFICAAKTDAVQRRGCG